MHIPPDPGSSASPPAGVGESNSLPVSLDHPAEEHHVPGPTKPSQPVVTLPPPYTAADVPSQSTGAVAGSSDQVSSQPQNAPTKNQTAFLAQVGKWFEAHKLAASCIALFVAFAGLLVPSSPCSLASKASICLKKHLSSPAGQLSRIISRCAVNLWLRRLRQGKYYEKCSNTNPRSIHANPGHGPVRSEQAGLRTGYSYRTATRLFRRSYHPELA
ncbi:predicted protein [Verticillium alfalfae VaMs.102]|uniref:Predicted protein n=1 Tax=Verticillium alfalfae (strain VaMs.102 / ATCC MYA-4576 / FGSC 10136) TaxID=526221 RepID=C9SPS9_VERA1|nr:predicted protein [Verticillium alfalfae VaMs.102]EEY20794.1 predicted protein [Verticillium alfalfae VaMs.102]